jgi:hypothetical protein
MNHDTAKDWYLALNPVEKHVILVLTSANSDWIYESEKNLKETEIPLNAKGDKGSSSSYDGRHLLRLCLPSDYEKSSIRLTQSL